MLEILRGALAVFAGYAAMTALVILGAVLLGAVFPGPSPEQPTGAYIAGNLVWGALAAAAGGWIAARIAVAQPMLHAGSLAVAIIVLGMVRMSAGPAPGQPDWFIGVMLVLAAAGALAGGFLASRRRPA